MTKEDVQQENTEKNTDKRLKNLKPAWKKGDKSPNPKGHPKGQRNYATIYREALIKIGKSEGKTPAEIENEIIANGALLAKRGDFRFYKDLLDRLHGTATQNLNLGGELEVKTFDEKQLSTIAARILNGRAKK